MEQFLINTISGPFHPDTYATLIPIRFIITNFTPFIIYAPKIIYCNKILKFMSESIVIDALFFHYFNNRFWFIFQKKNPLGGFLFKMSKTLIRVIILGFLCLFRCIKKGWSLFSVQYRKRAFSYSLFRSRGPIFYFGRSLVWKPHFSQTSFFPIWKKSFNQVR